MAFVFLMIVFILISTMLSLGKCCENIGSISVKENTPYPSTYLLDVANLVHISQEKEKENIYLTDQSGSKPFILTHGKLSLGGLLDREQVCSKDLDPDRRVGIQRCCSSGMCCMYIGVTTPLGKTVYVKVDIEDENDNEPMFPQPSIKVQIHENVEVGHMILLPRAEDLDGSNFGIDRYELVQDKKCGDCFLIKSESRDGGGPVLVTKTKIDREHNSDFSVRVLAIDKGSPARTGTLDVAIEVVDINDNAPQFEDTSLQVSEEENGRSGREIRILKVSDLDSGVNGQVSYSIEDFSGLAQKHFRLESVKHGVRLMLQGTLDFEQHTNFKFQVLARDHGTPSLSSTLSVNIRVMNVNDESPEISFFQRGVVLDPNNVVLQVPENGPKQQSLILAHVTDKDSRLADLSCDVVSPKDSFYLHENQQANLIEKKKLFELQNSVQFDRETTPFYKIRIMCQDSGGFVARLSTTVDIQLRVLDVNDNAPSFSSSFYFGRILETSTLEKVVDMVKDGLIKVSDPDLDANSRIRFSLADIGNATDSHKFSVSTHYAQIKNVAPIDFEEKRKFVFLIVARDSGTPALSSSATITVNVQDVNDNRPEIVDKPYSFSVMENQPPGTEIGRIEARDKDFDPGNKDLVYEIVGHEGSGVIRGPQHKLFVIENNSGRIRTKISLDHEKDQHVNFQVRVRNTNEFSNPQERMDGYGSSVTVNVKVLDLNDNAPILVLKDPNNQNMDPNRIRKPTITINNEIQSNSNLCSHFPYTFSDADEGLNAEIKVSLKKNSYFKLEIDHNLICPLSPNLAPGTYPVVLIGEDRNGENGTNRSEYPISIIVKSSNVYKQVTHKSPRQDPDEKSSDYKAVIIFIVLIATIILFCLLLMIIVVKTKLCIPRNMSPSSRGREKIGEKQNNIGPNQKYNMIIPGGSCENKRLCSDYISSLNNQNIINSDYSNNMFFPGTISPSMDLLNHQYPNDGNIPNLTQSNEFIFSGQEGTMMVRGSLDQMKNNDLRYEQLQRNTLQNLSSNTPNWEKGSLPSNCGKSTPSKQDMMAIAPGYQKSINDVYLQTSFV